MNDARIHFPDLTKKPLESYVDAGGKRHFKFKSYCGFNERAVSHHFADVTCLLCLRSIVSQIRRAAMDAGTDDPVLKNPKLFEEIKTARKKGK